MARQRRAAPPPPPPPQQSSSSEESGSDTEGEEEGSPRAAAAQMPPENPQPHAPAAAADGAESSEEEESDTEADTLASQKQPVSSSHAKPAAAVRQPESDADDEEEDGESSEPVQKKAAAAAAAAKKSKTVEQECKKRPAPDPGPSSKGKKAKADAGRTASEATPTRKGKKAVAELLKTAPGPTRSGKAKKPGSKLEKSELDSPPQLSRSTRVPWSKEDSIKVMEALVAHFKSKRELPATNVLLAAVGERLARKDCTSTILYEKVRSLYKWYNKTVSSGVMPSGEDDLQMYNLSEVIWGEKVQKAMAAATTSKKGQSNKDRMNGNSKGGALKEVTGQNGDTQEGSKKGQAISGKRKKLSREDAKSGTSKETAAENGDVLMKHKKGKTGKEKMDVGDENLVPKALTGSGTRAEEEADEEDAERGARVQRSSVLLHNMYPCLAAYVERIKAQHPCGETLMRAFRFISDEKAKHLESMIKGLQVSKVKARLRRDEAVKDVQNLVIGLAK